MNLTDAARIADKLMDEYCPPGWVWVWSRAKTQYGLCVYATQTIKLSIPLTQLNDQPTFETVVLHEIAHVIAGPDANHGPVWKAHARRLGIKNPKRCTQNAVVVEGKIVATCPRCGISFRAHKVTYALAKTQVCAPCYKRGRVERWVLTRADTGERIDTSHLKRPARRRRRRRY